RRLEHFAVSLSIGLAYRWLNPVGVADFYADGEMDVAVVEMPHLGCSLVIYSRTASRLKERGRLSGFSNHHMGLTIINLSVAFDVNNDGVVDMILPDEERRLLLQAMTFKVREFKRIAEAPVGAVITTSVVAGDFNGNGAINFVYGRADGTIKAVIR
ncbi:MAG: VCBS repeat-containing protein, partial [Pseudomonadota bacterium]|nr:VCBS repeat-containing protein [Pseudomonadota bacterium]